MFSCCIYSSEEEEEEREEEEMVDSYYMYQVKWCHCTLKCTKLVSSPHNVNIFLQFFLYKLFFILYPVIFIALCLCSHMGSCLYLYYITVLTD